jgi:hypothetical protein
MSSTATVRQARLRPECAERYPTLPVHMWTSATCLAELVASSRAARSDRPGKPDMERTLSEADFEFREAYLAEPGVSPSVTPPSEHG